MKTINRKSLVLSAGIFALGGALSVAQPSQAAPRRDDDVREEKREVKRARREVKRERRDVRQADTPAERRREQRDVERARQNVQRQREELRYERRDDRGHNRPGYNNRPTWNNRPANGGYGYGQSYTGTVTNVRSDNSFDVRIGGSTYNVYTNYDLPRGLSVGDQVRVNGERVGGNDIRQARVSVLRNR